MIIWVDGSHGIGKTTTIEAISRLLSNENLTRCSSDEFYLEIASKDPNILMGGYPPQTNERFMAQFVSLIESELLVNEIVLVDMSLVGLKLKLDPISYFADQGYSIFHVVLYSSLDDLKSRIQNDDKRDQKFALSWVNSQEKLISAFNNSYKIDTTGLSPDEIAREIVSIVFG